MALLTVVEDEAALAAHAAQRFAAIVGEAVRLRRRALVALTGGTTPRRMYRMLGQDPHRVPWRSVHVYWGDERCVPPDHDDSNYGMAREALLAHVPIPETQVHRMRGERPPDQAAADYERELPGTFDLMLLGLGDDAHLASIFPGSPVLDETEHRVAAPWVPHLAAYRLTLTPPALLDARKILVIVAGAHKAPAVRAALNGPDATGRWPAQILRRAPDRVEWIVDRAAAGELTWPHA